MITNEVDEKKTVSIHSRRILMMNNKRVECTAQRRNLLAYLLSTSHLHICLPRRLLNCYFEIRFEIETLQAITVVISNKIVTLLSLPFKVANAIDPQATYRVIYAICLGFYLDEK